MRVSIVRPSDLSPEQLARWDHLQGSVPELMSPYFCSAFTLAVGAVRGGVYVGVLEDASFGVGFFPFQRRKWGFGEPVGAPLSDHHGVVAPAGASWDPVELVRRCGLRVWDYDHLSASQASFSACHSRHRRSPILDLRAGFEAYARWLRARGSQRFTGLRRKARKLGREIGPLRLEWHTPDAALVERIIELKSQQCRRTGTYDFFGLGWTAELVRRLIETQTPQFGGVVSVLRAGDEVAAMHLGIRSTSVLHWWFPVYEHRFARYSPGQIMLLELAKRAASEGLAAVDLGAGDDAYKASFANAWIPLAAGSAVAEAWVVGLRRALAASGRLIRRIPLRRPANVAYRLMRGLLQAHFRR